MKIKNWVEFIVTVGFVGCIPWMPGTFGAAVGLLLGWPVMHLLWYGQVLVCCGFFILAVVASEIYERQSKIHDSSSVVIDEVVGMLIALFLLPPDFLHMGLAFLFFRFFDIVKPFPVGWADRRVRGGFGVVFDDVLAGVLANIFVRIALMRSWW